MSHFGPRHADSYAIQLTTEAEEGRIFVRVSLCHQEGKLGRGSQQRDLPPQDLCQGTRSSLDPQEAKEADGLENRKTDLKR